MVFMMGRIENLEELIRLCRDAGYIKLYGAGLKLASFMDMIAEIGIPFHAECVLVSSAAGNPASAYGIPVVAVQEAVFHETDVIFLTVSERFTEAVKERLAGRGITGNIYELDYTMIDMIPYHKIYNAITPFVRSRLWLAGHLNLPVEADKRYVWTCWWQGEENAPELVKRCWESQRRNLPDGAEHVVITWDNYRDYAELPEFVTEKAECGKMIPAHLSDLVRCCLLYKYGGIWLDATVFMTGRLPESCFDYDILTRSTGEKIYCTGVSWVTWFLGGKKGEELYRFVMEAFFYYLKDHEEVPHYYMIDFLIAAACREAAGVEEKFRRIPVNNVSATELQRHLKETYDEELYRACTEGSFLQKLTYKDSGYCEDSVYRYLIHSESGAVHEKSLRHDRDYF